MTDLDKLLEEYSKSRDKSVRNKIIEETVGLVKIVAGKMYNHLGGTVSYEDIESYGIIGLIDSIDKFDIGKGVKFNTYAPIRIRGAILDKLRALDWVPREVRKKSRLLQDVISVLSNELGREPSNVEIADRMEITPEELNKLLQETDVYNVVSLEEYLEEVKGIEGMGSPSREIEELELKEELIKSIGELKEQERLVISLYYYDELTLKEIGYVLGVTESRVSQIHSKAILKLRGKLENVYSY